MDCYICNAAADAVPSGDDYVHFNCPECLEYKISGMAIAESDEQQSVTSSVRDVVFIRGWLGIQRIRQNTVAPVISSDLIRARR